MPLWKKLWLLFSAIWVGVAALNVFTILAFGENPAGAAIRPLVLMVAVPAADYALGWMGERMRRRGRNRPGVGGK